MNLCSGSTIVVAGLSARLMAESARRGGWRVIALDAFGDVDTRRACGPGGWLPVGADDGLRIDGNRLCAALAHVATLPGTAAWVAGSGFDADTALLDRAARVLPLIGMPGRHVAALRDPRRFFATLDRLGLPHPEVRFDPPPDTCGWLAKQGGGSGGWQVRDRLPARPWPADGYAQRRQAGVPMSALFVADGRRARVVGLNRLRVQRRRGLPFVHAGVIGPVQARPALRQQVAEALDRLVPALALRGLASLDFIADGDTPWLLEVNARPPASMAVHEAAWPHGLLDAHLQACAGQLPAPMGEGPDTPRGVAGSQIVWAPRALVVSDTLSARLAALPGVHDVPMPGTPVLRGAPLCSVDVEADGAAAAAAGLAARAAQVRAAIETAAVAASAGACEAGEASGDSFNHSEETPA